MRYSLHHPFFAIISGFLLIINLSLSINQLTLRAYSTYKKLLSDTYPVRMIAQKAVVEAALIFAG